MWKWPRNIAHLDWLSIILNRFKFFVKASCTPKEEINSIKIDIANDAVLYKNVTKENKLIRYSHLNENSNSEAQEKVKTSRKNTKSKQSEENQAHNLHEEEFIKKLKTTLQNVTNIVNRSKLRYKI
jgi:hypothetical protein